MPLTGDRKPFPVLRTEFIENAAHFSPDGRWLAYASNESGLFQVYVRPAPQTPAATAGSQWQISTNAGHNPQWRRDGKELFYLTNDDKIMAAAVTTGSKFEAGPPKPLFETRISSSHLIAAANPYAVAPDGQRFLFLAALEERAKPVAVVLNWTAEIKR